MKKLYVLLIFFSVPLVSFADITGSGDSSSDPYTGTMSSGTFNIPSGTKYFNQITVTGGTLNIAAGATLYATATSSYITVSSTGVLNADGDIDSDIITFTSNTTSWARITISSSGTSLMDYCNITKGYRTGSGTAGYGGGLLVESSNVTISNCVLWENTAQYGGGIFVNSNVSPTIKNCHIYSNTATKAGGGLYIYTGSGARVENCLIEENECTNTSTRGGGGISTYSTNGQTRIINCTIVNNTHSTPNTNYGNNIEIHDANTNLQYINCVVWGGSGTDPSVYRSGAAPFSATHFVNSAVQSVYSSSGETAITSYTNSFKINTSNIGSSPPGPYFTDPSTDVWTLRFASPCRDAGTNSGTPTPPSQDYLGKNRIGQYDIGIYEVQYCRWKTNASSPTSWTNSGNWEENLYPGSTGSTGDVIIPAGVTSIPDVSSVTMETGTYLIIDPKAQATISTLNNNSTGTLWLKSDRYGINDSIASLKVGTYSPNSGTTKIDLYLQGNSSMWHYISPPVSSLAATTFSSASAAVADYQEDLIEDNMNNGWVTSTGYHYDVTVPGWVDEGWNWTNLLAGKGYNYYAATSKTFSIDGTVNTGNITTNLVYNSGSFDPDYPDEQGYNLIGNPYTCGIDWDEVISYNSIWDDVESTIYFRVNGVTHYYGGGFTVPNTYNSDGSLIPPMQGFFIKSNASGQSLTIPVGAKVHTANKRYKGESFSPHIRLQFENSLESDQTIVSFNDKATLAYDNLFDGRKIFTSEDDPYIYSLINGTKYSINGIPFPENSVTVPLVINANTSGSYTIKASEITDLNDYTIYLKDQLQNLTVNLSQTNSYSFNSSQGLSSDRFLIIISNILTAIPENSINNKPFIFYSSGEQINIQTLSDDWSGTRGEVKILDLTGKTVSSHRNIEFWKDEIKQVTTSGASGIYFIEIRSGQKRFVGKVVIK